MEQSLESLSQQIDKVLEKFSKIKAERNELREQIGNIEQEIANVRSSNEEFHRANLQLTSEVQEANRNVRDFDHEKRIKDKVDELLAKFDGL